VYKRILQRFTQVYRTQLLSLGTRLAFRRYLHRIAKETPKGCWRIRFSIRPKSIHPDSTLDGTAVTSFVALGPFAGPSSTQTQD